MSNTFQKYNNTQIYILQKLTGYFTTNSTLQNIC